MRRKGTPQRKVKYMTPHYWGTQVTGIKLTPHYGNLRAFVNVQVVVNDKPVCVLRGVRIVCQPGQRAYVQMPCQQSQRDRKYYPIIKVLDPNLDMQIKDAALGAYERAISNVETFS